MPDYQQTGLWRRTLGDQGDSDEHKTARTWLRCAYEAMREQTNLLLREIDKELQELTVHDISHIDALWEMAGLTAGEDYPINPAEAFVLGAGFLLHDAGLALASYPGGLDELKATREWADALAVVARASRARVRPGEDASDPSRTERVQDASTS